MAARCACASCGPAAPWRRRPAPATARRPRAARVDSGCTGLPWPSARPARISLDDRRRHAAGRCRAPAAATAPSSAAPANRKSSVQASPQRRLHLRQRRPGGDPPARHLGPVERLQRALALEVGGGDRRPRRGLPYWRSDSPGTGWPMNRSARYERAMLMFLRSATAANQPSGSSGVRSISISRSGLERHDQRIRDRPCRARTGTPTANISARATVPLKEIRDVGLAGLARDDVGNQGSACALTGRRAPSGSRVLTCCWRVLSISTTFQAGRERKASSACTWNAMKSRWPAPARWQAPPAW